MSGNTKVFHLSASGATFRFDLNDVPRLTLTEKSLSLASGVYAKLQTTSFPTGHGAKLATSEADGTISVATGISVVGSGIALGFGPLPASAGPSASTRGDLRHSNNTTMTRVMSADGSKSLQIFKVDNTDQSTFGESNVRGEFHQVSASGYYDFFFGSTGKLRLNASGAYFFNSDISGTRRINGRDGQKSFGELTGGAATATVAVNAGSGTIFAIPTGASVAQLYTMQPSALDRDMVLLQNRSAATHTIYSAGTPSGALFAINPSGAAWVRFSAASGSWELFGRHQMGAGT